MALCTKCGTVMNDLDAHKHVCDILDIPTKGEVKIPHYAFKVVE